jgi:hypothetical protein
MRAHPGLRDEIVTKYLQNFNMKIKSNTRNSKLGTLENDDILSYSQIR